MACAVWFFIVGSDTGSLNERAFESAGLERKVLLKDSLFALILVLGILENLSASGNMLSMERDWIVAVASPNGRLYDLTHLNSALRRIDLICKLIAPILISVVVSATSVRVGVLAVGGMSVTSWAVEVWCAKMVWNLNPRLREPKPVAEQVISGDVGALPPLVSLHRTCWSRLSPGLRRYTQDFRNYFSSMVWIPSLSLSFLHISALAYNATFITYLLAVGFSLDLITVARAAGSIVEISSTVITPVGVQILSKAQNHGRFRGQDRTERESEDLTVGLLERTPDEENMTETGLERLGLWGISFQLVNLVSIISNPRLILLTISRPLLCLPSGSSHLARHQHPRCQI